MKNRPIHENLDTSYVNLSALVRYLRRRQFNGTVRVELSGYEADITIDGEHHMRVREHDRIAGRISEGDEALQRLLIRAREPGGIINVYQVIEEENSPSENEEHVTEEKIAAVNPVQNLVSVVAQMPPPNGNHKNGNYKNGNYENGSSRLPAAVEDSAAPESDSTEFSLELNNKFEARARQANLAPEDWQMLLNLTAELLGAIDKILAEAHLEFTLAFEKARTEICGDYPFMNPASDIFRYQSGKIVVRRQINANLFVASINEILRRILNKLGRNPKFANVYLLTTHKILALIEKRQPLYDKFCITPQLARTIGI